MRDYEKQLIEGLSEEEAKKLIRAVNGINRVVGLKKFGEENANVQK
jgi:hypothetical protein